MGLHVSKYKYIIIRVSHEYLKKNLVTFEVINNGNFSFWHQLCHFKLATQYVILIGAWELSDTECLYKFLLSTVPGIESRVATDVESSTTFLLPTRQILRPGGCFSVNTNY